MFAQPLLQWKSSKYYTFCTCACRLSHPAYKQHAPYYTVICALSGSTTFFHKNGIIFWKRLLNIKCVFWFSLQLLSQIFLILRTEQDIFINVHRLSCKVPVILVRFIHFLDRFLKKILKYQISCKSIPWAPRCFMRRDEHRHDEANSRFSQFCKCG